MKELDDIVNEQALLLKWNGYTEKQLNNGEAEGSYKEHLKLALQDILEADRVLFDREPFQVHLFGCFNQGKDKVLYTFSYEYDAFLSQISLKEVQATLNDVPISVSIDKGSDIWSSQEMYKRVRALSATVNRAFNEERDILVKGIIQKELELLKDNDYASPGIESRLTRILSKIENDTPKQPQNFKISGKYKVEMKPDVMNFKLHYYYDPANLNLQLKSVYGRVGNASRVFMTSITFPIPSADGMYTFLYHENKSQNARKLLGQSARSQDLKRRLK